MTRRQKRGIAVIHGNVVDGIVTGWGRFPFYSVIEAARCAGCRPSKITEAIRVRGLAGGFAWRRVGTPAFSKLSRREILKRSIK